MNMENNLPYMDEITSTERRNLQDENAEPTAAPTITLSPWFKMHVDNILECENSCWMNEYRYFGVLMGKYFSLS